MTGANTFESGNFIAWTGDAYDVYIFKTNIRTPEDLNRLEQIFSEEPRIKQWNVDTDDIDNVLRIVSEEISMDDLIKLTLQAGYCCEELPD